MDKNERHKTRMQRKKVVVDEAIAKADKDKGLIVINTGNGKGKSSAAFGVVARALGHNMKVGIVQFIKSSNSTGEETFFRRISEVDYHVMGDGFTWETQNRERDTQSAKEAWKIALSMLQDSAYNVVILDELNIVLKYDYLSVSEVMNALQHKPEMQHVVITGRGAKQELIDIADTVTEMNEVKHAFKSGIRAQKGVER